MEEWRIWINSKDEVCSTNPCVIKFCVLWEEGTSESDRDSWAGCMKGFEATDGIYPPAKGWDLSSSPAEVAMLVRGLACTTLPSFDFPAIQAANRWASWKLGLLAGPSIKPIRR